jgi:hypothetical protein
VGHNAYKQSKYLKERDSLEDLAVDGKIIYTEGNNM